MGIGVHTGRAVIGNIGSAKRAKYGVVGRTVNLAGRVEGYTVGGQVLISEATRDAVDGEVGIISELDVFPKGVQKALRLYDIGSVSGGRYEASLERVEQALETLDEPVPVRFRRIEGKDISAESETGAFVAIGPTEAELRHDEPLPALTDLAIRIVGTSEDAASIYAKVLPGPAAEGCSRLGITSLPDDARAHLEQLRGPL